MMKKLKFNGSGFPVYNGKYILRRMYDDEIVCPFVSKTGYINPSWFSVNSVVEFIREKDNHVDPLALKVFADGIFIGYLYRASKIRTFLLAMKKKSCVRYIARIRKYDSDRDKFVLSVAFYVAFDEIEYELVGQWPLVIDRKCPFKTKMLSGKIFLLGELDYNSIDEDKLKAFDELYGDMEMGPDNLVFSIPPDVITVDRKTRIGFVSVHSCPTLSDIDLCDTFAVLNKSKDKKESYMMVSVYHTVCRPILHTIDEQ